MISWSRVNTYKNCPYEYYLKYVLEYRELPEYNADDPLEVGKAIHEAIAGDRNWEGNYRNKFYNLLNEKHYAEIDKIKRKLPLVQEQLPSNATFEEYISDGMFQGYIDMVEPNLDGTVNLWDFKYTDNKQGVYPDSKQLSLYKYYYQRVKGVEVRDLYYLIIHKSSDTIEKLTHTYDYKAVINFLINALQMTLKAEYPKNKKSCYFCRYKDFCNVKED